MKRTTRLLAPALLVALAAIAALTGRAQASATHPAQAHLGGVVHVQSSGAAGAAFATPNQVIFNNLGPGGAYDGGNGWCVNDTAAGGGGCGLGPYQKFAGRFTGDGSRVTQIDLALTHWSGTNNATIELAADGGGVPGTVLASWSVANQAPFGSCCVLTTVLASPSIPVGAGRYYWVVAIAGPSITHTGSDVWNWTYGDPNGPTAFNQGGGWIPYGGPTVGFDVLGCAKLCKVT